MWPLGMSYIAELRSAYLEKNALIITQVATAR